MARDGLGRWVTGTTAMPAGGLSRPTAQEAGWRSCRLAIEGLVRPVGLGVPPQKSKPQSNRSCN